MKAGDKAIVHCPESCINGRTVEVVKVHKVRPAGITCGPPCVDVAEVAVVVTYLIPRSQLEIINARHTDS